MAEPSDTRTVVEPAFASTPVQAVLGYARGCGIAEIAPFVRSLRSVFSGRIILVVDRQPTLLAWLATHGVQPVVDIPERVRRCSHPVTAMFAAFTEILHDQPDIGRVVATRVRNVVFQSDPFGPAMPSLRIYPEAGRDDIVDRAFGAVPRRPGDPGPKLRQSRRACAAIVLVAGPATMVARFSQSVVLLRSIPPMGLFGTSGPDRAAAHVIADLNLKGGEVAANDRRMATLARTPSRRVGLRWGLILNADLTASAIVHGYDRIDHVHDHVQDRWGLPSGAFRWLGARSVQWAVVDATADTRSLNNLHRSRRSPTGRGRQRTETPEGPRDRSLRGLPGLLKKLERAT